MPVILTTHEEVDVWMMAPIKDAPNRVADLLPWNVTDIKPRLDQRVGARPEWSTTDAVFLSGRLRRWDEAL